MQKALPVGTILRNKYIVQELLSKGASSAVYLVNSVNLVEAPRGKHYIATRFALKEVVIPNRRLRHQINLETIALRGIDHEGLPHIYEVFSINKYNRLYILMDYIEGPNLEKVRLQHSGRQLPLPQVMTIMAPILDAVSYLHSQQHPIIHQNIEPISIILSQDDTKPVLVGFGVGKQYTLSSQEGPVRDPTIGYEAPEQYDGEITTRSDIYGLGATLYTLITGIVPDDARYRKRLIESENIDPLKSADQLVPAIPAHVAEAIQRAMSLNSNDRFPTVEQLHQALKADLSCHQAQKLHLHRGLELDLTLKDDSSLQRSSEWSVALPREEPLPLSEGAASTSEDQQVLEFASSTLIDQQLPTTYNGLSDTLQQATVPDVLALPLEDQQAFVPDVSPFIPIDQQVIVPDVEFSDPSQPQTAPQEQESPASLLMPLSPVDQQLPETEAAIPGRLDQSPPEPIVALPDILDQPLPEAALPDIPDRHLPEPVNASLTLGDQQLSVGALNGTALLTPGSLSSPDISHDDYSHLLPDVDIEMSFSQAGCEWFVKTQEQQNNHWKDTT
jgi:serine/threonine protein kinase